MIVLLSAHPSVLLEHPWARCKRCRLHIHFGPKNPHRSLGLSSVPPSGVGVICTNETAKRPELFFTRLIWTGWNTETVLSLGRCLHKFWKCVSEMWVQMTTGLRLSRQYTSIYDSYLDFHVVTTRYDQLHDCQRDADLRVYQKVGFWAVSVTSVRQGSWHAGLR